MEQAKTSLYAVLKNQFPDRVQPQLQRKATLTMLSHAIEDEVLNNRLAPVVFAAFQNARYYEREQVRYEQLRRIARAVTIYGEALSEEVKYDRDWFVVINDPRFKVVLASYEIEPLPGEAVETPASETSENYRPFLGLWSYEQEIVDFASRYLAHNAPATVAHAVEEVVSQPHQPLEQVRFVSNVSDRILSRMEKTNQRTIHQISHNQQLLLDLSRQADMLHQVDLAKQMAENERNDLHRELMRLYHELTRSQTIMTQAVMDKTRLEQNVEASRALLQQLYQQTSQLEISTSNLDELRRLVEQIQRIFNQPHN